MDLMILPETSEWTQLTDEARELSGRLRLGELQHSLPTKVGVRKKSVRRVYVFTAGVVWQEPGARELGMRWSDLVDWRETRMHTYRDGVYSVTDFSYELTGPDGVSLRMASSFKDGRMQKPPVDRFGPPQAYVCSEYFGLVLEKLSEARLPDVLAAVSGGEPQVFGSVTLSPDGITVAGNAVPWEQVEGLTVDKGMFQVSVNGRRRPLSHSVNSLPRFSLLRPAALALLAQRQGGPRIG